MKNTTNTLPALTYVALSRSFGSADFLKKQSANIGAGIYKGTDTVKVEWSLERGEASEKAPTSRLMSKAVIAKAVLLSGIQADKFFSTLEKVALDAMKADESVGENLTDDDKRVLLAIDQLEERVIAKLPKVRQSGIIKVQSIITPIEREAKAKSRLGELVTL